MNQQLITLCSLFVLFSYCQLSSARLSRDDSDDEKPEIDPEDKWTVTKTVYLDFTIDLEPAGRVAIALFGDAAPNTVNNFAALAKGNYRGDPKFGFKGTKIHRSVIDFVIQGGDITTEDGSGGKSIYGPYFNDEPFHHSHAGPGYLSMANKGEKDTNSSQFFIILQRARWLDEKHIVFGKVVEGMDLIRKINNMESNDKHSPKKLIIIEDCGLIKHDPYVLPEDQRYV
ncbi:peptidyl-prolyl cis-trans isomerase A-like isoform X1 [Convolutriloba macropyga]|uniref:peptidyl-prolyl cis-trans isomerase A-like isoform X1 n=1 Tax=Convolutriloba macropyga TaxID=536237 RepID=UPI003F51FC4D